MESPKKRERMTEMTVPMGLNMDINTGPLFFIAHPLKLIHAPLMLPACCIHSNIYVNFDPSTKMKIRYGQTIFILFLPVENNQSSIERLT